PLPSPRALSCGPRFRSFRRAAKAGSPRRAIFKSWVNPKRTTGNVTVAMAMLSSQAGVSGRLHAAGSTSAQYASVGGAYPLPAAGFSKPSRMGGAARFGPLWPENHTPANSIQVVNLALVGPWVGSLLAGGKLGKAVTCCYA